MVQTRYQLPTVRFSHAATFIYFHTFSLFPVHHPTKLSDDCKHCRRPFFVSCGAERIGDEIVAEANAKADAAIRKADADIAQSKKKAINEIKNDIAGISVSIAEKVVEREINEKDHTDLIESFIETL